jgi:hypothetical protein
MKRESEFFGTAFRLPVVKAVHLFAEFNSTTAKIDRFAR